MPRKPRLRSLSIYLLQEEIESWDQALVDDSEISRRETKAASGLDGLLAVKVNPGKDPWWKGLGRPRQRRRRQEVRSDERRASADARAREGEPKAPRGARDPEKSRGLLRNRDRAEVAVAHRFIAAEKVNHSVSTLCRVLEVSRSGYYAAQRRPACRRAVEDRRLGELIATEHKASRETYGAPRIHTQLTRAGERVGRKRVARLMRQGQLSGLVPRRRGKTTIRVPGITTSPDLVRREWNPTGPNRLWVADITYIRTWEGWLYLAAVVDCYSRKVVGWSIADNLRAELVVDAVEMAISRRRPAAGLVHHSDRGSQYVSLAMGNHLKEAGIDTSMGSQGSPLDNAVAESFFATFKKELINRRSWPEKNECRSAIFEWIEVFYNRIRLHTTIGSYAPEEFESLRLSGSKEAA